MIETCTVGAFNLTAIFTRHEHWLKEAEEVRPMTDPINCWIEERLTTKQIKQLEANMLPALLALGVAEVLVPDIVLEWRIRESNRRAARAQAQGGAPQLHTVAGGAARVSGGGDSQRNGRYGPGGADQGASDPSYPPPIPGQQF